LLKVNSILQDYLLERKKVKGYLFIPYVAVGDPNFETSFKVIEALIETGADTVELGLPFTDPTADGPVLQESFERILASDYSLEKVFVFFEKLNKRFPQIPFCVMGYANVFYHHGFAKIFKRLKSYNIHSYILPDIPLHEKKGVFKDIFLVERKQVDLINFVTPTTKMDRLEKIVADTTGFIYVVSIKGVTGARNSFNLKSVKSHISYIKKNSNIPVMIGFGISKKSHAKEAIKYADGFIIGSKIHLIIKEFMSDDEKIVEQIKKQIGAILP